MELLLVWIPKVPSTLSSRNQAGLSDWEYAFLQYLDCTRSLDEIDKKLGYVCLTWSTTEELVYSMREGDNREFFVVKRFRLERESTIRGVEHVVRSKYSV